MVASSARAAEGVTPNVRVPARSALAAVAQAVSVGGILWLQRREWTNVNRKLADRMGSEGGSEKKKKTSMKKNLKIVVLLCERRYSQKEKKKNFWL